VVKEHEEFDHWMTEWYYMDGLENHLENSKFRGSPEPTDDTDFRKTNVLCRTKAGSAAAT
jgi:hypothetical protein